jgi:hypothetical protein
LREELAGYFATIGATGAGCHIGKRWLSVPVTISPRSVTKLVPPEKTEKLALPRSKFLTPADQVGEIPVRPNAASAGRLHILLSDGKRVLDRSALAGPVPAGPPF